MDSCGKGDGGGTEVPAKVRAAELDRYTAFCTGGLGKAQGGDLSARKPAADFPAQGNRIEQQIDQFLLFPVI